MNLLGIHDRTGTDVIPSGGWCVDAIALSEGLEPANHLSIRSDINWIIRLNWGWYPLGTIPKPSEYKSFASLCAEYVSRCSGVHNFIIGNEPNWSIERPQGMEITPVMYAEAFNRCRKAIKERTPTAKVIVAAVAPYNIESGPWIDYYRHMLGAIDEADGIALHFYSRGADPATVTSEQRMNPPYDAFYNGFRAYRDFLAATPYRFRSLPVYGTETNQMRPWLNSNTGWVQAAAQEIQNWNSIAGTQKISCLCLYRWENYDEYGLKGKAAVIEDFKTAAEEHKLYLPHVPSGSSPEPADPLQPREWDSRLTDRGVKLHHANVAPGELHWRLVTAQWLDTDAALSLGPDHHILVDLLDERGERVTGIPLEVSWPSGSARIVTKGNLGYDWAADYPMSKSLNDYSVKVTTNIPSDSVTGIGMGKDGNSGEHTSTYLVWQKAKKKSATPAPSPLSLTHPVLEPRHRVVTQSFGERQDYYSRFSIDGVSLKGHTGVDFATPSGSIIVAVDDGEVIELANDVEGYGVYVKLEHSWGESLYAHLSSQEVSLGEKVSQGQAIGRSGNTGNSSGPHLHFALRVAPFNRRDGWGGFSDPLLYMTVAEKVPFGENVPRIVKDAAREFGVDENLFLSQVMAESSFNPKAESSAGAKGLGQIMPLTWGEWSAKVGARDIFDARDNARVAAAYLAWCRQQTDTDWQALVAYGWGIGNLNSGEAVPTHWSVYADKIIHGKWLLDKLERTL